MNNKSVKINRKNFRWRHFYKRWKRDFLHPSLENKIKFVHEAYSAWWGGHVISIYDENKNLLFKGNSWKYSLSQYTDIKPTWDDNDFNDFIYAAKIINNLSIKQMLESDNDFIRGFGYLDKRCGKNRLYDALLLETNGTFSHICLKLRFDNF